MWYNFEMDGMVEEIALFKQFFKYNIRVFEINNFLFIWRTGKVTRQVLTFKTQLY